MKVMSDSLPSLAVALRGVSKRYGAHCLALDDTNLHVSRGEFLTLLGPTGSGKTTLLRLIAGLEEPTTGTIWFYGSEATYQPPHRRPIAYLAQNPVLYPHKTVRDNLAIGCRADHRSIGKQESRHEFGCDWASAVQQMTQRLMLQDLLSRWPQELSGGEKQRVALGRVLIRRQAVFLLDEPFAHQDGTMRLTLAAVVQAWHKETASTVICATHEVQEALQLSDRIAVLHRGKVVQAGSPTELMAHPLHLAVMQSMLAPVNIVPGRLIRSEEQLLWQSADGQMSKPVPAAWHQRYSSATGRDALLAVPAVDVTIEQDSAASSTECAVAAGRCSVLSVAGRPWVVPDCDQLSALGPACIGWKWDRAHLFDPASGWTLEA
ncbi:MAG: hypothetical protein C4297_08455 [Gemmataceae bacterium]